MLHWWYRTLDEKVWRLTQSSQGIGITRQLWPKSNSTEIQTAGAKADIKRASNPYSNTAFNYSRRCFWDDKNTDVRMQDRILSPSFTCRGGKHVNYQNANLRNVLVCKYSLPKCLKSLLTPRIWLHLEASHAQLCVSKDKEMSSSITQRYRTRHKMDCPMTSMSCRVTWMGFILLKRLIQRL